MIFHTEEALKDDYTLMDVAYIYTWRRVIIVQQFADKLQYSLLAYNDHHHWLVMNKR